MIVLYMQLHPQSEDVCERALLADPCCFLPSHWAFRILLDLLSS